MSEKVTELTSALLIPYLADAVLTKGYTGDIDTCFDQGVYHTLENTANMPTDVYPYGVLLVLSPNPETTYRFIAQIYIPHGHPEIYIRVYYGGYAKWASWVVMEGTTIQ